MASILEKIDTLVDDWLNTITVPTEEQVKILVKMRDTYSGVNKRKIDIRLRQMSDDELLEIVVNGTGKSD